jgi:hypothetical protein
MRFDVHHLVRLGIISFLLLGLAVGATARGATNEPSLSSPSLCGLPASVQSDLTISDSIGVSNRWSANKAWQWLMWQPWLVGCNFLPSTAVNDVEMWQAGTFDPVTIDRELGWAQELGFNTVRVFLNYVVWKADPEGLKERLGQFLGIAAKHHLLVMPILFDDCAFSGKDPRVGVQQDPVPGVHNSGWVPSPSYALHKDLASWGSLESYTKDIVGSFRNDRRVVIWDLYNEPSRTLALVEAVFRWAREARPSQPLTTCIGGPTEMQYRILALSDIISFHNYNNLVRLQNEVARLLTHGRPLLCTEYMARGVGSRFATHLPFFKDHSIGCWSWGLVAGRTQTYFPWGSPEGAPEPQLWHHDIFRRDGTPFSAREVQTIRLITGKLPGSSVPQYLVLLATSEQEPRSWHYTLERPVGDWFTPGFDDTGWKTDPAPFGQEEAGIGRKPNTVWKSSDIWLRSTFEMPSGQFTNIVLNVYYDEDPEVYINGRLVAKLAGYNAAYDIIELEPAACALLKPGKNCVAVHCRQTVGGQYIDLGIQGVAAWKTKASAP